MTNQPTQEVRPFMSDTIQELVGALVKAQAAFPSIPKGKTAQIKSSKGNYSYNYADLPVILDAVRPALTENGIAVTQPIIGSDLVTVLAHTSGEFMTSRIKLPSGQDLSPQELGSWLTYLRRYALTSIIGVAADEDDDASSAQAGHGDRKSKSSSSRSSSPPPTPDTNASIPNPFTGFVTGVKSFDGEKDGKKWRRYHLDVRGLDEENSHEFRTFSDTQGDLANSAMRDHRSVVIEFRTDNYGRKIEKIDLGSEDDVPF